MSRLILFSYKSIVGPVPTWSASASASSVYAIDDSGVARIFSGVGGGRLGHLKAITPTPPQGVPGANAPGR